MKVIMTIRQGNMDKGNFTRELDVTPQECDYLKRCALEARNNGGKPYIEVMVSEI